jgi:hypothetical protein
VADVDDNCAACEAEIPRPTVFIDPLAVLRWQELIDASVPVPAVIGAVQRVVVEGREVEGTGKFPDCRYFAHADYPDAVVVVKLKGTNSGGAAITVMRVKLLERKRVEYQSAIGSL